MHLVLPLLITMFRLISSSTIYSNFLETSLCYPPPTQARSRMPVRKFNWMQLPVPKKRRASSPFAFPFTA
uniref:Putative secreted protein n=1 Tax=Panstrongylus lignarius TaxID=156445 RepID=A0A224XUL2_9HEMI